jgi:hypothetical protein
MEDGGGKTEGKKSGHFLIPCVSDNSGEDNSGDIIINSIPVKAGRPCADIECILEQRKAFVKRAGWACAGRAGRGGGDGECRIGLRREE